MNDDTQTTRDYGFALGMLAGTALGVAAIMLLAPRAAGEVRRRIADAADEIAERTSDRYREIGDRLEAAVEGVGARVRAVRNGIGETAARSAHEAEGIAAAAKAGTPPREL